MTPEFMVAEGDKVVTYARLTGTHTGEFMGAPASNKTVEVEIIDIVASRATRPASTGA